MTAAQPGDELREAIAEALTRSGRLMFDGDRYRAADAVLPVVTAWTDRRIAAVLRAAAQEQRNEAGNVPDTDEGTHADGHRCAADFLDRRAAQADNRAGT